MINHEAIHAATELAKVIPLVGNNVSERDYHDALELVEYLLDHDEDSPLMDILCARITAYESTLPGIIALHEELEAMDGGVAMLRVLIDQHKLTLSDFENEIGKKSMVSLILSGKRSLTLDHVRKLSARFGISPALFV